MLSFFNLNNFKTLAIVMLIPLVVWFYKDYNYQKSENVRQTENARQQRIEDSLNYSAQILSKKEIEDHLNYQNRDLKNKLHQNNIKINRITSIISQKTRFKDSKVRETNLQPIVRAIKQNIPSVMPVIDSTACLTIKGVVEYKNDSLKLKINKRNYNNESDVVGYIERRKWRVPILGINTRFWGKRQATVKVFNKCGEVQTKVITKKKN